eukprot:2802909-Rhodomonas_salina.2
MSLGPANTTCIDVGASFNSSPAGNTGTTSNGLQLPFVLHMGLDASALQHGLMSEVSANGMSSFMGNGGFLSPGGMNGMAGFIPPCQVSQGIGAGGALASLSMPSPPLSLRAQMVAPPTFRPNTVAGGGISKMQQKQSSQAKPKGSKHNISNPVKMTSDIKYADKADSLPNGDKQVFAVKVNVANAYPIMSYLQDPKLRAILV